MASAEGGKVSRIPIIGAREIPPDPRMFQALASLGYTLPEAVADLVDNSIDAAARNVLIRILRAGGTPVSLVVVDDGRGIEEHQIDTAMKVGGVREYGTSDLGMFGLGMKSASFSQADSLAVFSRASGRAATGRVWVPERARRDWKCDVVEPTFARDVLDENWSPVRTRPSGTVVRWDEIYDFQRARKDIDRYLDAVITRIRNHLGLQLHRFLSRHRVDIRIDVEDVDSGEVSSPTFVEPLDPFSYPASGARGYPKTLLMETSDLGHIPLTAHVWPPNMKTPGYRLGGGAVPRRQGFYFYRRDRLVQAGGWNGFRDTEPHTSLARVSLELQPPYERLFRLTVKKSGVEVPQSFIAALPDAHSEDGTTFARYLDTAQQVYRRQEQHEKAGGPAPGKGLPAPVRRQITAALGVPDRAETVDFVWEALPGTELFRLERDPPRLLLNALYRAHVLGGKRASGADAPLFKSLLFLLLERQLRAERLGARQRAELEAWQKILVAAVRQEASE
jgi:hypothetical protein